MNNERNCKCGCGRKFTPPHDALHKVFATSTCRQRWHKDEAKRALAALRVQQAKIARTHDGVLADVLPDFEED
jgi:hypothetical protein